MLRLKKVGYRIRSQESHKKGVYSGEARLPNIDFQEVY